MKNLAEQCKEINWQNPLKIIQYCYLKQTKKDVKMRKFLLMFAILLLIVGVKFIFDARPIVKKYFSFGQENDATLGMKILGFIFVVLGAIIFYFKF